MSKNKELIDEFLDYKDNISIFEAIALAGDITDYGNLTKVKIIRTEQNKKRVHKIDLTKENIID